MGYTLTIGEAVIDEPNTYDHDVRISVTAHRSDDAPHIANETVNVNTSERWPSYTTWHDFAESVGLKAFFFDKENGLISAHPGCVYLRREHAETLTQALARYRGEHPNAAPGYVLESNPWTKPDDVAAQERPAEGRYFDGTLARLVWCEFWVRWALANCRIPAFGNS